MHLHYHGHATLQLHSARHRILIDPFFTSNPLADIKADQVNPTHIFVSHAHFDHCEDALAIAQRTGALLSSNFEISNYYQAKGLSKLSPTNYGGTCTHDFGKATFTLAFHSSTFQDGANGGQPGGWILEIADGNTTKTIYFAGDTALFGDMKLIGELWNIDLACLPIGDRFTMGPAHAIKAAAMLKPRRVLPIHYNTWPPIEQDAQRFASDLKRETGIEAFPLKPGQTIDV